MIPRVEDTLLSLRYIFILKWINLLMSRLTLLMFELTHIEPDSAEVFEPSPVETANPMRSTDERRPEPETTEV